MDPRLAQILQDLNESTSSSPLSSSSSGASAQVPAPGQLQFQQPQQSYDPRLQIYKPDRPQFVPAQDVQSGYPPAAAAATGSDRPDPRTITQWPAAVKYITTVLMKLHQRDHEKQWWHSREAILKRHSNSSSNQLAMDSVLQSFGIASKSSELTEEEKAQELSNYDTKVHRASEQMYKSMAEDFKKLDIPFFVISEEEYPGTKEEFTAVRKKVIELLDDLT
ncbi:hypothetical protein H072_2736 [Dactylellina haptotyla CBS 200.50]|uniref:Uncharacterized protein n=1 Tax=Dactylellina haptotyla (strain CBS 200.50) TaxID=1284197 RepID=S8AJZ3_DACHA|nr:hypothetical protein H072_2736 [Dactylellina haptotyla CBS 200.50]